MTAGVVLPVFPITNAGVVETLFISTDKTPQGVEVPMPTASFALMVRVEVPETVEAVVS